MIRTAVEVAGPRLGAIRLDSGDLLALAHHARRQLGATSTRIMVTSDLDKRAVAAWPAPQSTPTAWAPRW